MGEYIAKRSQKKHRKVPYWDCKLYAFFHFEKGQSITATLSRFQCRAPCYQLPYTFISMLIQEESELKAKARAEYTANISVVIITIFRSVSIPIVIWL